MTTTSNSQRPYLESIQLVDPPANAPWAAGRLVWEVKFSEPVRGVGLDDFFVPPGARLHTHDGTIVDSWNNGTEGHTFFVSVSRASPDYFYDESVRLRIPLRLEDVDVSWLSAPPSTLDGSGYPSVSKGIDFPYENAGGVWFKFTNQQNDTFFYPPTVPGVQWETPTTTQTGLETWVYAYPGYPVQGTPSLSPDEITDAVLTDQGLISYQPLVATPAEVSDLTPSNYSTIVKNIDFPYVNGGGVWAEVVVDQPIYSFSGLLNFSENGGSDTPYPLNAAYPLANAGGAHQGPIYVYLTRSAGSSGNSSALEADDIEYSLMQTNYGATITSLDNDPLDYGYDETVVINQNTPNQALPDSVAGNLIQPDLGAAGFDTLDLRYHSAADRVVLLTDYGFDSQFGPQENLLVYGAAGLTHAYSFANFDRYIVGGNIEFYGSDAQSEVVQIFYSAGSNNQIYFGHDGLPDINKTDVVDYSLNSSISIKVDLTEDDEEGDVVTVEFRSANDSSPAPGADIVYSAEGVFGSQGDDDITGDDASNVLWGAGGNDTLKGGDGDDFLLGGAGTDDVLEGGQGKDRLIDFDGAVLSGRSSEESAGPAQKDVFIVQNGSTIRNFHLALDGAGLAGRANTSANDIIAFSLSMSTLVGALSALQDFSLDVVPQEMHLYDYVDTRSRLEIERVGEGPSSDDWLVSLNFYYSDQDPTECLTLASVRVENVPLTGGDLDERKDLAVVKVTEIGDPADNGIDWMAVQEIPDVEFQALRVGGSFGVEFALEAVAPGTVRNANANGLMFGNTDDAVRIFNPGEGSQRILGSKTEDRYQFLSQTFDTPSTDHEMNRDKIIDTGGNDSVEFADLSFGLDRTDPDYYSAIEALEFSAVTAGRETGFYSLKTNYTLAEDDKGEFIWFGHFRRGFDMQLEEIVLGKEDNLTVLYMADVVYSGASRTPQQVALEGKDTIFVGGVGRAGDNPKFVINVDPDTDVDVDHDTNVGNVREQHLFFWGAEAGSIEANFSTEDITLDSSGENRDSYKVSVDHDSDPDTNDISIYLHFMTGLPVSIEEMFVQTS